MTLHETWVAAKKQALKDFKEAQKNYLKAQDKKINESKDAKAKKKALDMVLGEAGLDKGESLDDYLKFADGFGKQLDALEKVIENNSKLKTKYGLDGGVAKIIANKDAAKQLLLFCQRSMLTSEITLYLQGYKKSPTEVWNQYLKPNAPDWLDLGVDQNLQNDWTEAAKNLNTLDAKGKKLVERLRVHIEMELDRDVVSKYKNDATAMKNLGIVPQNTIQALARQVLETAVKYDGEVDSAVNRWSKLKPQFWQPLKDALEEITEFAQKPLPQRN